MAEHLITLPLDRRQIEASIEALVGLLDTFDGDADAEPIDEREPDDEENSPAWIERTDQAKPPFPVTDCAADYRNGEDIEDDEGGGDTSGDEGEPDFRKPPPGYGPGCKISDDDYSVDDRGCDPEVGI